MDVSDIKTRTFYGYKRAPGDTVVLAVVAVSLDHQYGARMQDGVLVATATPGPWTGGALLVASGTGGREDYASLTRLQRHADRLAKMVENGKAIPLGYANDAQYADPDALTAELVTPDALYGPYAEAYEQARALPAPAGAADTDTITITREQLRAVVRNLIEEVDYDIAKQYDPEYEGREDPDHQTFDSTADEAWDTLVRLGAREQG